MRCTTAVVAVFALSALVSYPHLKTVLWHFTEWQCELWVTGPERYELRLFQHDLLVRSINTTIHSYSTLADSWRREIMASAG